MGTRWNRMYGALATNPLVTAYWASDKVQLLPNSAVETLRAGGYPPHATCVLCDEQIVGDLDWWHLDKVSGPCCGMRSGCRQARNAP